MRKQSEIAGLARIAGLDIAGRERELAVAFETILGDIALLRKLDLRGIEPASRISDIVK